MNTSLTAEASPSCASETTHLTPDTPRLRRPLRNAFHDGADSVSTTPNPTKRLFPSVSQAMAVTTPLLCTCPSSRQFT